MSYENPTDFEMGLCTKEGIYFPESVRCMGCRNLGSDGNPDPENPKCCSCTRNENIPMNDDLETQDNFTADDTGREPEDPYYTWFDEDGGEHVGRDEP